MLILLYVIILVLIIVPFYILQTVRKLNEVKKLEEWKQDQKYTTLEISVPRNNDKAPLAAEQMFAALHGIYVENVVRQPHLSFEIVAKDKYIQFYVYIPENLRDFVMGQIYAQYPTVEIKEIDDYPHSADPASINFATCELAMTKPDVYPIKLFGDFEVDPLSGITSVMSHLAKDEEVWLQLVIRPVGDEWQEKGNKIVSDVRAGKKSGGTDIFSATIKGIQHFARMIFWQAVKPGTELAEEKKPEVKLPASVEEALKGIEYKITKLGFETKVRVLCVSSDPVSAKVKCQNVAAAFKQFNTTNLNGFKLGEVHINELSGWTQFVQRSFEEGGNIFNISELASIYHLPHETVSTPSIVWSGAKKGEPPANLPLRENTESKDLTVIGETTFRNNFNVFGIKRDDRRRHIYIIGKSGVGKSVLIENMAIDDVVEGRGVIVIDPHGDLADKILSIIPDHRVKDVVVFDPADRGYPIAFNLLEHVDDDFKGMVASGFVGIFKKIFGESWGPRLEHILRNTVLALLDYPESTMLDIPKMLTDNHFRDKVVDKIKDPVIRDFWVNEFAAYDAKFRTEAVSPILNKVGQFLSTSTIRNIVGQPHSKINIREIMDQEKIMVVNLSRGKIGEDNSALLGAMMVTKVQLAAMSRADVSIDKRPDCYLYVDEFQNFATDSFATILAEARKYNLNLTIANQYITQLPEGVRDAVFGNAGTMICFRVGGADASFLVKEYEPVFEANDLVNLDKYNIYIKLLIDGISSQAFSARTLPPVQMLTGNAEKVLDLSRVTYSNARALVEEQIAQRARQEEEEAKAEAEMFRKGGLEALLVKKSADSTPISDGAFSSIKPKGESAVAEAPKESVPAVPNSHEMAVLVGESVKAPALVSDNMPVQQTVTPNIVEGAGESPEGEEIGEAKKAKKKKKRVFRYQNIIGDVVYKEQTARGGVKWYIGEQVTEEKILQNNLDLNESARKTIELTRKAAGLAPIDFEKIRANRPVEARHLEDDGAENQPIEQEEAIHEGSAVPNEKVEQNPITTEAELKDSDIQEVKDEAEVDKANETTEEVGESSVENKTEEKVEENTATNTNPEESAEDAAGNFASNDTGVPMQMVSEQPVQIAPGEAVEIPEQANMSHNVGDSQITNSSSISQHNSVPANEMSEGQSIDL